MALQAPKGTKDVLPAESYQWQYCEQLARDCTSAAGYEEIRTPVFEHTELFLRGVGDTTDVVQKEMYTFNDKGGRSITLKPEGTAGVVRAFIESGMVADVMPCKMYYLNCPVFRYDKPQAGRYREHHQFGVEAFGSQSPAMDADVVSVAMMFFKKLGLKNLSLRINSIGCPECRPKYQKMLKEFLRPHLEQLCETCKSRYEKNPMRILDCKEEGCKRLTVGAPSILDALCPECSAHFEQFKKYIQELGFQYVVDPGIVRGLDYYTKTVFEIITEVDGKPLAICAGGRYDGLVKTIGGPQLPGIGFGMGLERVLLVAQEQGIQIPKPERYDVLICSIGQEASKKAFELTHQLRALGVKADCDLMERSLKAQFKFANKIGVPRVLVIGEEELASGRYKLRDMRGGEEKLVTDEELKKLLIK